MRSTIVAAVLLLIMTMAVRADEAQPEAPKSPVAVAAIKKSDAALEKAEEAYRTAKIAAFKQLIADLKLAMANATKAGNLDEANAIKAASDNAQVELDALLKPEPKYSLWETRWPGGGTRNSLKAGGTTVNQAGDTGSWTRRGNVLSIKWGPITDTVKLSPDGKAATGINSRGVAVEYLLIGTDADNAEQPPQPNR